MASINVAGLSQMATIAAVNDVLVPEISQGYIYVLEFATWQCSHCLASDFGEFFSWI